MADLTERLKELGIDPTKPKNKEEEESLNFLTTALTDDKDKPQQEPLEIISDLHDLIPDEDKLLQEQMDFDDDKIKDLSETAEAYKVLANDLFREGKYEEAMSAYCDAIESAPAVKKKQRAILFANRAATKIKMGHPLAAIEDCSHALTLDDKYVRAYQRRAELYEQDKKLDLALKDHQAVLEFDHSNKVSREASERLSRALKEEEEKIKAEALQSLKGLGDLILKPFGLSVDNFQMTPNGEGGYSINMKQ